METQDLDQLKDNFLDALETLIHNIRRLQELLSVTGHSAISEDTWKQADFARAEAEDRVNHARAEYEEAVRKANFGF